MKTSQSPNKRVEALIHRLFLAKQIIEKAKSAYKEADQITEYLLSLDKIPKITRKNGIPYQLHVRNLFEGKNTQWKSVAMRAVDIEFERLK